jgi:hypothetical protein
MQYAPVSLLSLETKIYIFQPNGTQLLLFRLSCSALLKEKFTVRKGEVRSSESL